MDVKRARALTLAVVVPPMSSTTQLILERIEGSGNEYNMILNR